MKTLLATAALALLLTACSEPAAPPASKGMMQQGGMMQSDKMQGSMAQDGKMQGGMMQGGMMQDMESLHNDVKNNCQQLVQACKGLKDGEQKNIRENCQKATKSCHSLVKKINTMDDMHKLMMHNCHKMMQGGMMNNPSSQPTVDSSVPSGISPEEHKAHHPEK
jgi:hypothetical protein